jgi:hypothetical protein
MIDFGTRAEDWKSSALVIRFETEAKGAAGSRAVRPDAQLHHEQFDLMAIG